MAKRPTKEKPPAKEEPVSLAIVPLKMIRVELEANPRGTDWVDSDELEALKVSIVKTQKRGFTSGLLQSVTVKPIPQKKKTDPPYQLVAGYRRFVALQQLSQLKDKRKRRLHTWADQIPCIIQLGEDANGESTLDALVENLQRQRMPLFEEAKAFDAILKAKGCTRQELAKTIGKSPAYITQRMSLLKFEPEVQARAAELGLGMAPLRDIARLPNAEEQLKLLDEVAFDKVSTDDLRERVTAQVGKSKRGRPKKETPPPEPSPETTPDPSTEPPETDSPPPLETSFDQGVPVVPDDSEPSEESAPAKLPDHAGDGSEGEYFVTGEALDDDDDAEAEAPAPVETESVQGTTVTDEADLTYLHHVAKTSNKHAVRLVCVAVQEWEKRRQGKKSAFSDQYSADSLHEALADKMDFEF